MKKEINIGSIARANAKSISNQLTTVVNGINQSKVQAKKESNLTGQNGHSKSDKVHSLKSMDNFKSVAKNFFQYVKDTQGGRIEKNINVETAKDFILTKLDKGLEGSSANTYISILGKVAEGLEKMTNKTYITKEEFKNMKAEIKEQWDLKKVHRDRAYKNPDSIEKEMQKFSEYQISTKLQIQIGLRIDDTVNSQKWKLNENGTMTIIGSKNGIAYETKALSAELRNEVKLAISLNYEVAKSTYAEELKEAVENTGQTWQKNSSHGLRYNFAQSRLSELIKEGKSFDEAKGQVSLEMGHSRLSITDTYIR